MIISRIPSILSVAKRARKSKYNGSLTCNRPDPVDELKLQSYSALFADWPEPKRNQGWNFSLGLHIETIFFVSWTVHEHTRQKKKDALNLFLLRVYVHFHLNKIYKINNILAVLVLIFIHMVILHRFQVKKNAFFSLWDIWHKVITIKYSV